MVILFQPFCLTTLPTPSLQSYGIRREGDSLKILINNLDAGCIRKGTRVWIPGLLTVELWYNLSNLSTYLWQASTLVRYRSTASLPMS